MARDSTAPVSTARYAKKREAILAAATEVLNQQGVKGMTLSEVAQKVGLNTTSVTYYFRKKEDLAAACFLAGIERINAMTREAAELPTLEDRLTHMVGLWLDRVLQRRAGEAAPFVIFMDIRTLEEPHLRVVSDAYTDMVRRARDLLDEPGRERKDVHAATELLLDQLFWSPSWLSHYDDEDFPRLRARLLDILLYGVAPKAATPWPPRPLALSEVDPCSARETFLVASTRLLNRLGYRGASVEKISAELNVTKGSFYHHNEAKDELVLACFDRTDAIVREVQHAAVATGENGWDALSRSVAALIDLQGSPRGPLLRTLALAALPDAQKLGLMERTARTTERFAAMVSDGIADGSVRAIDPMIAAHMLKIGINAAADLDARVRGATHDDAMALMTRPLLVGLAER